ncbi:MAG: LysM peptidoglycan-binding domain-containing protein [Lysobacterales bacterium]|jgi:nucleoid-associated protein YgaU
MGIFDSIKNAFGKAEAPGEEEPASDPVAPAAVTEPEMAVTEPAEAESTGEARSYTVQRGDTLWRVAERMYGNGDNYQAIFEANRETLETPDQLLPGQKLVIPAL